ncbi:MAG: alpha/beta hydrolase [Bacteroidota bacterium]
MQNQPYSYEVEKLRLPDGSQIAYREFGEGEASLLLLHGLGSYLPVWDKMRPHLEKDFKCVVLDLPGFGQSSTVSGPISIEFFAKQIEAFVHQKKLKNLSLIGHSMGGQIAMRLCLNQSIDLQSLILLAPAGIERFSQAEGDQLKQFVTPASVLAQTEEQITQNFAINFYGNQLPEDASFMVQDRLALKGDSSHYASFAKVFPASMTAMLDGPVYEELDQIKIPVLVLFGADDQLIPNRFLHPDLSIADVAKMAERLIPSAEVKLLEQCGHFVPWDQAERVSENIRRFTQSTQIIAP